MGEIITYLNDRPKWFPIIAVAITFLTYIPSLLNGWVNWDDPGYVLNNQLIQTLDFSAIKDMFSTIHVQGLYHPLTLLSLAVDYQVAGAEPLFYHVHNLVLHMINVALVYIFIERLGQDKTIALLVALLFGIHPMHVESVAWISARKDVLYTAYFMGSLIVYQMYLQKPGKAHLFWLSWLLCVISALSKGLAFVLPALLILLDYENDKRLNLRSFTTKIPFLIVSGLAVLLLFKSQSAGTAMVDAQSYSIFSSILLGLHNLFEYTWKALLPVGLSPFHPYPDGWSEIIPVSYYVSAALMCLLLFVAYRRLKHGNHMLIGGLFFLIIMFPHLQLIGVGKAVTAERYTYIAYVGLFYVFISLGREYLRSSNITDGTRRVVIYASSIFVVFLLFTTVTRITIWKENIAFWSDVANKYPDNHLAYCNRASTYLQQKQYENALKDCNRCIELRGDMEESYNNRGMVHLSLGNLQEALSDFNQALTINHKYTQALGNRAALHMNTGNDSLAIADFDQLNVLRPGSANTYFNMAIISARNGRFAQAQDLANRCIQLSPTNGLFYYFRATVRRSMGNFKSALSDLGAAASYGYSVPPKERNALIDQINNNNE